MGPTGWVVVSVLGVTALVMSIFLVPIAREYFRAQHVTAVGIAAPARVLGMRDTGSRVNAQPVAAIKLEVLPTNGTPFDATATKVVSAINASQFATGKMVTVKYDPSNKSSVVILGPAP